MQRRYGLVTLAGLICVASVALYGLRGTEAAAPAASARAATSVAIQNFTFTPQALTIAVGTTVTWTNKDSAPHTVTSDTNAWTASSNLSTGQTFSYTFTKAGTFAYHCAVHPGMKAEIIVTAAGGSQMAPGMNSMGPMSKLPMSAWTGFYDKHPVMYLSTDTSSKVEASRDHINYAPSLAKSLAQASEIYITTNGSFAGRGPVFGAVPGGDDYTPLWQEIQVTWKNPSQAVALGSDDQIKGLAKAGKLTLRSTGTVLNCPIIKVTTGSM